MVQTGDREQLSCAHSAEGVAWQVAPDWDAALFGPEGLRLAQWQANGALHIVKDGPHRVVYRIDLPQGAVFLKHYRPGTGLRTGRRLLIGPTALRECENAWELARRRVPTARPLAWGQRVASGGDNYLITEAIPEAQDLEQFLEMEVPPGCRGDQARLRRLVVRELGRWCAAAHRAGVVHTDFHLGNILVRAEPARSQNARFENGTPLPRVTLFLIDLPDVRLSLALSWRKSRQNLAVLLANCARLLSRSELVCLWNAYAAGRADLATPETRLALEQLGRAAAKHSRRIARRRDRRSLGTNRDFYPLAGTTHLGHAVRDFPRGAFAQLLADPGLPLREGFAEPIKLSHSSVVVRAELAGEMGSMSVAYKRGRGRTWWKSLSLNFRRSRALIAWQLGHALLLRGIPTARPLAVCEPQTWGLHRESYLATQWLEGATNLHLYGWELAKADASTRRRRVWQCAESLGRLVGKMHAWRVTDRDLKGCNLVVVERPDRVDTYLIDLDGVRIARWLSPRTRARDLARLATSVELHPWLSRTDRLRFLRAYWKATGEQGDWKRLWQAIAARSACQTLRLIRQQRLVA